MPFRITNGVARYKQMNEIIHKKCLKGEFAGIDDVTIFSINESEQELIETHVTTE